MNRTRVLSIGLILIAMTSYFASTLRISTAAEEEKPIQVAQLIAGPRPIGLLGKPLGNRVVLVGTLAEHVMLSNPLAVASVDGQKLPKVVNIESSGLKDMKPAVTYKVEGYESGGYWGDPEWLSPGVQQPFQYHAKFVVTHVIDPPRKQRAE